MSTAKAKASIRMSYTRYGLTAAELEVLSYLCDGITNLEIANRRGKNVSTIKVQLGSVYKKLEVGTAKQAILIGRSLPEVQELLCRRAGIKPSAYERFLQHMTDETHEAGHILFRAGDPADKLYFVQEGSVLLLENGKRRGAGDWIGEMGMFTSEGTRTRTAKCETKTRLLYVSQVEANKLFHEQPEFLFYITQLIANRFREDSERAADVEVVT